MHGVAGSYAVRWFPQPQFAGVDRHSDGGVHVELGEGFDFFHRGDAAGGNVLDAPYAAYWMISSSAAPSTAARSSSTRPSTASSIRY